MGMIPTEVHFGEFASISVFSKTWARLYSYIKSRNISIIDQFSMKSVGNRLIHDKADFSGTILFLNKELSQTKTI